MSSRESGQEKSVVLTESEAGERLDKVLGNRDDVPLSRSKLQKLIKEGSLTVNGETVPVKYEVQGGETVSFVIPEPEPVHIEGEALPLDVVFEDQHIIVVNKAAGMVTHPAAGNRSGTLVHALVHRFGELARAGGSDRPGIVHRLDKETSGLLVIARDDDTHAKLQKAIQSREVKREYLAVICGHVAEDSGTISLQMARSTRDRKKMRVVPEGGRDASTSYQLTDRFRSYDRLSVSLGTGRTHQIRVHFSHLGHPVLGDPLYGGRAKWHRGMFAPERPLGRRLLDTMKRQCLHARRLEFTHPQTGEALCFEAPIPEDLAAVLDILDREGR